MVVIHLFLMLCDLRVVRDLWPTLYRTVWVQKDLSDRFAVRNGLKQGDALSLLLYNFAIEYAIRRVQVMQGGIKLHGKYFN
jgi:hypothetical protein